MILVSEWPHFCQNTIGRIVPIGLDSGTELTTDELHALGFVEAAKTIDQVRANEHWFQTRETQYPKRRVA